MSRITVVGAGYVGLVTGAGLANLGHSVMTLEVDRSRLDRILAGSLPIYEPGLDDLVACQRSEGRLEFSDDYAASIPGSDFVILAVNTPPRPDGSADTTFVEAAVRAVLEHARPGLVIVTKSTVPIGTGDEIDGLAAAAGVRVDVASNPEFLREGTAVHDFMHPDRIVVGAGRPDVAARVADLYAGLVAPVILTSRRSAEMAKYAANAFLAAKVSFMNEMAGISEAVGADIGEIERIIGSDTRIGPAFLKAGIGWGGSCFPKDVRALVATAADVGREHRILDAVVDVNGAQRDRAFAILRDAVGHRDRAIVGVLGLAFKPDTDDLRGSPAIEVIGRLLEEGISVQAHDPAAMPKAGHVVPTVRFAEDAYHAATDADAILLATDWAEYGELDWSRMRSVMRGNVVVDGRNVLPGDLLTDLGFDYRAFGRAGLPAARPATASDRGALDLTRSGGSGDKIA